jgi:7-cyano-7-deazaguanine synthase
VGNVKALVLLSGGLDSTTCAAIAIRDHGFGNVHGVSFVYGQKHDKEVWAAKAVADYFRMPHKTIQIPNVFTGSGSTLIDADKPNPKGSYADLPEGISPTYVPFRNGILTSYAAAVALTQECDLVYFGAHSEDAANWAYPDCTPEFIGAMAAAIYVGTYHKVRLITPLQWMDKTDVVQVGLYLNAPYNLTWSCYNGRELACGVCPTCISRREAFTYWGSKDPITYADEVATDGE